jgi:hypothetical protein
MFQCTTWPEHSPFWACLSTALASCAHSTCGLCRCDDASITPSFVIHSHPLDGIAASVAAYRLSFPLLTHVRQAHAWGWCFYSTTWRVRLSLTGTLSCQGSRPCRSSFVPCGTISSERVAHTACSGKCGRCLWPQRRIRRLVVLSATSS